MDIHFKLISSIIIFIVLALVSQVCIPKILRKWRKDVERFIEDNLRSLKDREYKYIDEIEKQVEVGSGKFIFERTDRLGYISRIAGIGEILFFGCLTMLLFKNNFTILSGGEVFFKFFGGWLAVKTITNYDQWSHVIAGKAYLYITLFGTFLNILLAFIFGALIYWLGIF